MPDPRRAARCTVPAVAVAVAVLLCAGAWPAPARADSVLVPTAKGRNIAAAGGYLVWAAPSQYGGFRLIARYRDGTVRALPIAAFGAAPDPAIGSDRFAIDGRRIVVVYARCSGVSATRGCDLYRFQLNGSDGEERIDKLATKFPYSESAPSIASGRYTFVRRGGARPGVYYWRGDASAPRRISRTVARETATNGTRVAYAYRSGGAGRLSIRRLSGEGNVLTPVSRARSTLTPYSISLDRYRATWLLGSAAFQTDRLTGARRTADVVVRRGDRALPNGANSIVVSSNRVTHALTPLGVVALSPALRFR